VTATGDEFLTVAEIAAILKLNQQTVRNWIDQGTLPALRVGRRVRVRRSDFDALLERGVPRTPQNRSRRPPRPSGRATCSRSRQATSPKGLAPRVRAGEQRGRVEVRRCYSD
jgi:excisionase family DNA binding protein